MSALDSSLGELISRMSDPVDLDDLSPNVGHCTFRWTSVSEP
jgi:hypothetical protein